MNHFESGKVAQSSKKMAVDGAHHRHQSKLNEVTERMTRKEVRQSDIAVGSETDSKRTKAISTFETSPEKAVSPLQIDEAKSGISDQVHFRSQSIVKVVHRAKQTKWIDSDDEIIRSQRGREVEEPLIRICRP
jgi:hypothetical protein